jgi:hypothetical protein
VSRRNARLTVHGGGYWSSVSVGPSRRACGRRDGYLAHYSTQVGTSLEAGGAGRAGRPFQPTPRDATSDCGSGGGADCRLRQECELGPGRIGPIVGLPASTAHRTLARHGLNRLPLLDRSTGWSSADRSTGWSSAATNAAGPASWSTWPSRSSVPSPAAAAGGESTTVPPAPTAAAPPDTTKSTLQVKPPSGPTPHLRGFGRCGPRELPRMS